MLTRSTSFGEFKRCPKRAYYMFQRGLVPARSEVNPHLFFGIAIHRAVELFHKKGYDAAISYINALEWPPHRDKNQTRAATLIGIYARTNKIALTFIEHLFEMPLGNHIWKGRIDALGTFAGRKYIVDHKTTNPFYLQLSPNDQFIAYWLAATQAFEDVVGVLVNNFDHSKLVVQPYFQTYSQKEADEWVAETVQLLDFYERCIGNGVFPKNPTGCQMYGSRCAYYMLCTTDPETAESMIERSFEVSESRRKLEW